MASELEKRITRLETVQQVSDETARVLIHPADASPEEVHGMVADLRRAHPVAQAIVCIPDNGRDDLIAGATAGASGQG